MQVVEEKDSASIYLQIHYLGPCTLNEGVSGLEGISFYNKYTWTTEQDRRNYLMRSPANKKNHLNSLI